MEFTEGDLVQLKKKTRGFWDSGRLNRIARTGTPGRIIRINGVALVYYQRTYEVSFSDDTVDVIPYAYLEPYSPSIKVDRK